jgi:hypothetical protein
MNATGIPCGGSPSNYIPPLDFSGTYVHFQTVRYAFPKWRVVSFGTVLSHHETLVVLVDAGSIRLRPILFLLDSN